MDNITSANSIIVLTCDELFPAGVQLDHFSADQSITQADEQIANTRMGVDGHMSAGWIPSIKTVTITVEPTSDAATVFDTIYSASAQSRSPYKIGLTVNIPALGKVITYKGGTLKNWKKLPDHKDVLDPIPAVMDFETVE